MFTRRVRFFDVVRSEESGELIVLVFGSDGHLHRMIEGDRFVDGLIKSVNQARVVVTPLYALSGGFCAHDDTLRRELTWERRAVDDDDSEPANKPLERSGEEDGPSSSPGALSP